jgi:hypothetical protein
MQYQFTERREYVKTIEFQNSQPLKNIQRIRFFKEEGVSGTFVKKEYRYSFDNSSWSNWNTLTQINLAGIQFKDKPDFWLHVKYTRIGVGSGNIQKWYLYYDSDVPTPPVPPTPEDIDATTLQGEGPEYYLDRTNHFGPYTGLSVYNVPDGASPGVYSHRVDNSTGTDLYFKRLEGSGGISVSDVSGGKILIDASGIQAGASYENPDPVNSTVGGISAGSAFFSTERTFEETMQAIFYPTLFPALSPPFNGFTFNASSLYLIGSSISISFTASFNRGSINPAYGTTGFRSGMPNTYNYVGTGLPGSVSSSNLFDTHSISGYMVAIGNQSWTGSVSYDAGPQPKDSEGNDYLSPLPAGTTSTISRTIEGVYPLFGTTSNISTLSQQPLVSMISGNNIVFNMVAETGGNKQRFDIPDAWPNTLINIETFNTVSGQWDSTGLGQWTVSPTSHVVVGNTVNYTRYTYNGDDRASIQIRLKF